MRWDNTDTYWAVPAPSWASPFGFPRQSCPFAMGDPWTNGFFLPMRAGKVDFSPFSAIRLNGCCWVHGWHVPGPRAQPSQALTRNRWCSPSRIDIPTECLCLWCLALRLTLSSLRRTVVSGESFWMINGSEENAVFLKQIQYGTQNFLVDLEQNGGVQVRS